MKKFQSIASYLLITFFFFLSTFSSLHAASADLSIDSSSIWYTPSSPVTSYPTIVYARVKNNGDTNNVGTVTFTLKSSGEKIGTDQPVSVLPGSTDDVFINWDASYGKHEIVVKVIPWNTSIDNAANNTATISFAVDLDTDKDHIGNQKDSDDDGDGCIDTEDVFPTDGKECYDSDGDAIGDNSDEDADNDGTKNVDDAFPVDSTESLDTDKDNIGNSKDDDDDGDTIKDAVELTLGTDPLKADTDSDELNDSEDKFPLDSKESKDNDNDGIGDNADSDDDNDDIIDGDDQFPFNPAPNISFKDKEVKGVVGNPIDFDGSASFDPNGENIDFLWEIDGQTFNQPKITYEFDKVGQYKGNLTVTDEQGQSKSFDFDIKVVDYSLYIWISIFLIILLAIILILKYISEAKNKENSSNTLRIDDNIKTKEVIKSTKTSKKKK